MSTMSLVRVKRERPSLFFIIYLEYRKDPFRPGVYRQGARTSDTGDKGIKPKHHF